MSSTADVYVKHLPGPKLSFPNMNGASGFQELPTPETSKRPQAPQGAAPESDMPLARSIVLAKRRVHALRLPTKCCCRCEPATARG
ncbi:hypothetical protein AB1Y20_020781 [Prymnesium parvum]|uniref:Uncharacterized protein n=1 Tax=Prymnesium parvum TaxID=97485 RepID=A0AB34JZ54_PRYPA